MERAAEANRSTGQLGDQRGATPVTSPSTHSVCWHRLMHTYCTWACAALYWAAGGRVCRGGEVVGEGGHCRPLHLFSSQAICSVSLGTRLLDCGGTQNVAVAPAEQHGR